MNALPTARHGRPRGYIEWRPRAKTARLVDAVTGVLDEYSDYLPMTIRQIFYRLFVTIDYEKTERGYARLCETLNRARRAQLIPFDSIRDDGFHRTNFVGWDSIDQAKGYLKREAAKYRIDRQRDQDSRLVVGCEAQGMVPQLERVAGFYSSGGFDSVTVKHSVAEEFSAMEVWAMLRFIEADDRDIWVKVGGIIKDEFGDSGYSLWTDWRQSSDRYIEKDAAAVWKSLGKNSKRAGIGSIVHLARQRGWTPHGSAPEPAPKPRPAANPAVRHRRLRAALVARCPVR